MDMELIKESIKIFIRDIGKMGKDVAKEMKFGLMELFFKVNIKTIKRMDLVNSVGLMDPNTKVNFSKI